MYNKESNEMNGHIAILVLLIVVFVIIANIVMYVSLNIRLSGLEEKKSTEEENSQSETVRENFSMSARTVTKEQLQSLAYSNPDYIYYISDIEVSRVDYNVSVLHTNIGYVITTVDNALYVRPGDTIDVMCKIGNSPEYGYYLKDTRVYVVRFEDKTLCINQNK